MQRKRISPFAGGRPLCSTKPQPLEFLGLTGWEAVTAWQASRVSQFKQQMAGGAQSRLSLLNAHSEQGTGTGTSPTAEKPIPAPPSGAMWPAPFFSQLQCHNAQSGEWLVGPRNHSDFGRFCTRVSSMLSITPYSNCEHPVSKMCKNRARSVSLGQDKGPASAELV